MKQFRCAAIVPGCGAIFDGESEKAILQQISSHARDEHGMPVVPAEVVDMIRANITERSSR
jgi:predicted small metal-binding protein